MAIYKSIICSVRPVGMECQAIGYRGPHWVVDRTSFRGVISTMTTEDVLIDGYVFFLTDGSGGVPDRGGLFRRDTRFLSELDLKREGAPLKALGSEIDAPDRQSIRYAEGFSAVNEISESGDDKRTATVLHRKRRVSRAGVLQDRATLVNHASVATTEGIQIRFGADFADLFEVRGVDERIERDISTSVGDSDVKYRYSYQDSTGETVAYRTTIEFDPEPDMLTEGEAEFTLHLASQESVEVDIKVITDITPAPPAEGTEPEVTVPAVGSDRQEYERTFQWAKKDLEALVASSPYGPVLLAGAPWFATVFGRDSLLTAFQVVPVAPRIAAGVLSYLAAYQSENTDPARRAEPGKLFHEIRHGELARRGKIRYDPFYGSIDATALWIVLLEEYYQWTGDDDFVATLEPSFRNAMKWLTDAIEDGPNDPFVYYQPAPTDQLTHTAWRDSEMSVQFSDGTRASPPLASAEVQGYAYDALLRGANLLRGPFDDDESARRLEDLGKHVRERFNETFWLPERDFYATAVAEDGRLVDSLASNVGQCLWSGVVDTKRAESVVEQLFASEFYTGWGIRSMATSDAGYSPVSYHVGSVWPHDNSLIALGLARYGYNDRVEQLAADLFDATCRFGTQRFPEVFCGFSDETQPVTYPASCEPQAWGAGSAYALIRALLGVSPPGPSDPVLPADQFGLGEDALALFTPSKE